jgi:predicted lipid-binding transport protein (Tim44 family)
MNEAFDPFNLLILAIALIIFWRLRGVLGRRTGNERKPFDAFEPPETADKNGAETQPAGNVVNLPGAANDTDGAANAAADDRPPVWEGYAESGSPLAKALTQMAQLDRSFDCGVFLNGAKVAYEMIVTAFDAADRKTLKTLLGKDVYEAFDTAISDREEQGTTIDSNFVGIDSATIIEASTKAKTANVTVKFISQLISSSLDREGRVIDGDPKKVREVTDIWTFMRDLSSNDPNWKLIATEAAN